MVGDEVLWVSDLIIGEEKLAVGCLCGLVLD